MASKAILLTSQFNQQLMWLLATATGFHFSKTWICFIFLSLQGRFFVFCCCFFDNPCGLNSCSLNALPTLKIIGKTGVFSAATDLVWMRNVTTLHLGMLMIIWLKPRFFSFPKLICYCCQHVLEDIFWYFFSLYLPHLLERFRKHSVWQTDG